MSNTVAALGVALVGDPKAFSGFEMLDTFICMTAQGGLRLTPLLDRIDQGPDAGLADLLVPWNDHPTILWTAFWEDVSGAEDAQAWHARPELAERMMTLGEDETTDAITRDRAWAVAEDILMRC